VVKRPSSLNLGAGTASGEPVLDKSLMRRFPLFVDMLAEAERRIPKRIAGYLLGGADSERGMAENCAAFQRVALVPRYGVDLPERSLNVELFGRSYGAPIGVAPVGYTGAIWPGAERALAKAAQAANVPFITSTFAIEPLETIIGYAPDVAWFQLYCFKTMDHSFDLIERAKRAGYRVLVVTVDIPVYSKRTRDHRNGLEFPPSISLALLTEVARTPLWSAEYLKRPYPLPGNMMRYAANPTGGAAALRELLARAEMRAIGWNDLAELRKRWPGKLVVKGIQHAGDAEAALAAGADGIIVSNHGGRQFDAAPASIDSLPSVVAAVGARATVMLDSGVRSGLDVARALVRGAQCCFAGRAFVAACAAAGNAQAGARHAMSLFQDEIATALGQLGAASPAALLGDRTREWR